jgi:stage V sporulation protein B
MSKFLKGTIILMAAGLITRILGFINRIIVARFIGEEGVGLFMMTFPTLILVITITQLGLPVAISKFVAEALAQHDYRKVKKILVVSLATTLTLSLLFTPGLILLAPFLAETLYTDPRTYYPLAAISPIIPIIAVSSVIRGYFQGLQNMKPAAISQILEQLVRITLIAVLTKAFLPLGIEYAAAGAMFASIIGELASLIYLVTMFKLRKKFRLRRQFFQYFLKGKHTFFELMSIALPATGSRFIGSISWFFEPIVVVHSLAIAGVLATEATKQYGVLTGYALPLLMLPSFITYSLSTSLVPAISEAYAQKHYQTVEHRVQQALRFALLTGGIAVVILYTFATPIMKLMYNSTSGVALLQLMAPFFIFYYYQGPLQAVLQALNLAKAGMINSFIGAIVKIGTIFILASQPMFGIHGAALGIITGFVLVTLLHFVTVLKVVPMTIVVSDYVKFILIVVASSLVGKWLINHLSMVNLIGNLLSSVTLTTIFYCLLLFALRLLRKEDLQRIPFLRTWLK